MSAYLLPFQPVIIIHLEAGRDVHGWPLAACCGKPFRNDDGSFAGTPRTLCTGCYIDAMNQTVQTKAPDSKDDHGLQEAGPSEGSD